jgi:hypothetical protein
MAKYQCGGKIVSTGENNGEKRRGVSANGGVNNQ